MAIRGRSYPVWRRPFRKRIDTTYAAEVLSDAPVAYWRQGEPSGTAMNDSSGFARNGTYSGTFTLGQTGAVSGNTAVDYAGTGFGSVTAAAWQDLTAAFTVEAWIKYTTPGTWSIVDRDSTGSPRPWQFRVASGRLQFLRINTAAHSTSVITVQSSASVDSGLWVHCVATYDGTDLRLYVNKVLENTVALTGGVESTTAIDMIVGANTASAFQKFPGLIDEVAYYGSALSLARISAHYDAAPVGGANWTVSQTDAAGLTDSAVIDQFKVISDSEGLTDSTATTQAKVTTDDVGLSDATAIGQSPVTSDVEGLTDTTTVSVGRGVTQTDTENLTDSVGLDQAKPFTDTEGLTDTQSLAQGKGFDESENLTDSATVENGKLVTQTDPEGLTDSSSVDQAKALTDAEGLTDTQAINQSKVVTDSEGLTDSTIVENGKLLGQTDVENLTDSVAFVVGEVKADDAGLTDQTALSLAKVVTESENLTDSASIENGRSVTQSDTVGMTDTIAIILGAVKVDTATLSDSVTVTYTKILTDLVGLTDAATVTLTGPVVDDPNPVTLTIRDTGHTVTIRAERAHTTVGSQAATTARTDRSRFTLKPSTHATTKENR